LASWDGTERDKAVASTGGGGGGTWCGILVRSMEYLLADSTGKDDDKKKKKKKKKLFSILLAQRARAFYSHACG
jgi:predicted alpha-1,6-mannanase (GH76 family)